MHVPLWEVQTAKDVLGGMNPRMGSAEKSVLCFRRGHLSNRVIVQSGTLACYAGHNSFIHACFGFLPVCCLGGPCIRVYLSPWLH